MRPTSINFRHFWNNRACNQLSVLPITDRPRRSAMIFSLTLYFRQAADSPMFVRSRATVSILPQLEQRNVCSRFVRAVLVAIKVIVWPQSAHWGGRAFVLICSRAVGMQIGMSRLQHLTNKARRGSWVFAHITDLRRCDKRDKHHEFTIAVVRNRAIRL